MPRKKKQAADLTTSEAMKKLFPKKVRDEAAKVVEKSEIPKPQDKDTP